MHNFSGKKFLVTGGAGFIGSHLVEHLLGLGSQVHVIDNFDPYYNIAIKKDNIACVSSNEDYSLFELDIRDRFAIENAIGNEEYHAIIHLAAKAGVRPSIEDPMGYQETNVMGTQNLLEFAKARKISKFIFGSSSSVYGVNPKTPWSEEDFVLQPISPYASSKISGELLGHVYSSLYDMQFLALRFFTVFGPRQRPDLAIHKFVNKIESNTPIPLYGDGSTSRDYTFVSDIVSGILSALAYDKTQYEIINLGNGKTITLHEMVSTIETVIGKEARIQRLPEQPGDVRITYASINKAKSLLKYEPKTDFKTGIEQFYQYFQKKMNFVY